MVRELKDYVFTYQIKGVQTGLVKGTSKADALRRLLAHLYHDRGDHHEDDGCDFSRVSLHVTNHYGPFVAREDKVGGDF